MKKTIIHLFLAGIMLLPSCMRELPTDSNDSGTIPVRFSFRNAAGLAKSSYSFGENEIKSAFIAAYDSGGELADACIIDGYTDGMNLFLNLAPAKTYNIYALANVSGLTEADYGDEEAIRTLEVQMAPDSYNAFPMCLATTRKISVTDMEPLALERLVSRWDFAIDRSNIPGLIIDGVSVRQAACSLYPFCADMLSKNYESHPADGDSLSDIDIDAVNDGETATFYIPENMQGTLLPGNNDPHGKQGGEDSFLATNYDAGNLTYIEIKAHFDQSVYRPEFSGDIIYRFYPGRDNTTNFDIERNSHHSVVFTPSYESATSREIEWQVYNADVVSNNYGHLEIWSTDADGEGINLLAEESVTDTEPLILLNGFSTGQVKAYLVDDNGGGIMEDVTERMEWNIPHGSGIDISREGILDAAGAAEGTYAITAEYHAVKADYKAEFTTAVKDTERLPTLYVGNGYRRFTCAVDDSQYERTAAIITPSHLDINISSATNEELPFSSIFSISYHDRQRNLPPRQFLISNASPNALAASMRMSWQSNRLQENTIPSYAGYSNPDLLEITFHTVPDIWDNVYEKTMDVMIDVAYAIKAYRLDHYYVSDVKDPDGEYGGYYNAFDSYVFISGFLSGQKKVLASLGHSYNGSNPIASAWVFSAGGNAVDTDDYGADNRYRLNHYYYVPYDLEYYAPGYDYHYVQWTGEGGEVFTNCIYVSTLPQTEESTSRYTPSINF